MDERQLDGIRVDGKPLAEVLKDQRDNKVIKMMDREVAVQMKCKKKHPPAKFIYPKHQKMFPKDRKPGKPRYLTRKELEEVKMERNIKKIEMEGLTKAEGVYVAFKENDWKELKSAEISKIIGVKLGTGSALISLMKKNGMLECEEKEPRKFYYSVSEDCQGLGRIGWGNMFREVQNRQKKEWATKNKVKKAKKESTPSVSTGVKSELSSNEGTNQETRDRQAADTIHKLVDDLNLALQNAIVMGLQVDLQVVDFDYKVSGDEVVKVLTIDHTVSRIL